MMVGVFAAAAAAVFGVALAARWLGQVEGLLPGLALILVVLAGIAAGISAVAFGVAKLVRLAERAEMRAADAERRATRGLSAAEIAEAERVRRG